MQFSANLVFLFRNLALPAADIQGDLLNSVTRFADKIGHIQFAAVPDRSEPDHGEVDYSWLLRAIADAGYDGAFGAEYRPATDSFASMERLGSKR
jgi:2-dehydrotetronate isomerase